MKFLSLLFIIALILMPVVSFAQIQDPGSEPPLTGTAPDQVPRSGLTTVNAWYDLVQQVIGWLFVIAVILGVIVLIIAGIMYITSRGGAQTATAGKMIIFAVVGIAVAALAWAIVNLVSGFFTGTDVLT